MSLTDIQLYANNVSTTLSVSIDSTTTTLPLTSGSGSQFPSPSGEQFFLITLDDEQNIEVCKVTGRSGDNLFVERGQEGTTPLAFSGGTMVQMRVTKGTLERMARLTDRLFDVDSVDSLPAASSVSGNSFICASADEEGNPIVAIKGDGLWSFLSHTIPTGSGTVTDSSSTSVTAVETPTLIAHTAYAGRYIVQFTSGALKGQARLVTSVVGNVISWGGITPSAPSVGDTFEVYVSNAFQFTQLLDLGLVVHRGEFGIGDRLKAWPYLTMDVSTVATGLYQTTATTVLKIPTAGSLFGIHVDQAIGNDNVRQLAWSLNNGKTYVRYYNTGTWSAWGLVYDGSSVSSTVNSFMTSTDQPSARTSLGLGTASTKDVGTGANNVMQVGAFGLGTGQGVYAMITDGDSLARQTGLYITTPGGAFTPPPGMDASGYLYHHQRINAGSTAQAFQLYTQASTGRMFVRFAINNAWQVWGELYSTNIVSVAIKNFLAAADAASARAAIGADNASNLTSGTIPTARLPSANNTAPGVIRIATVPEAQAGLDNTTALSPADGVAVVRRFAFQNLTYNLNRGLDWNSYVTAGASGITLSGFALNGPMNRPNVTGERTFALYVHEFGDGNIVQWAFPTRNMNDAPIISGGVNYGPDPWSTPLWRQRIGGVWQSWRVVVDSYNFQAISNYFNPLVPNVGTIGGLANGGYTIHANGLILQWGNCLINAPSPIYGYTSNLMSLPHAFPNQVLSVQATLGPWSADTSEVVENMVGITYLSTTQIRLATSRIAGSNVNNDQVMIGYWFAVGY